jgi:hypothetical protein
LPLFSEGIPRWLVLTAALAAFCLVPPETLARGPDLCLWKHLFHLAACPACGSTRALAAFFHGQFAEALAFNLNVVVTGPGLLVLLALDTLRMLRRRRSSFASNLNSHLELTTVLRPK